LFIDQLPAIKLLEVLVHYVNTDTEMLFPFIDNSIDNVLLQTNPGFLTSQNIPKFYLMDTLLHDS